MFRHAGMAVYDKGHAESRLPLEGLGIISVRVYIVSSVVEVCSGLTRLFRFGCFLIIFDTD